MNTKVIITIIGIVILLTSIGIGAYFANEKGLLNLSIKTDPTIQPTKIKITNINHDRFTISWITEAPSNGSVIFGKSSTLDQIQIDDGDQLTGQQIARKLHHITVTNLDPESQYNFKIRSGEKNLVFDNQGKPFTVKTAPVLSTQPSADLVSGTVINSDNKPAIDTIIYVNLDGAEPISTQVKKDGSWLINLASARIANLTDYVKYDLEKTNYEILVQGTNKTSKVLLITSNDSPVPKITLGETYDFTQNIALATPAPSMEESTASAKIASQYPLEPNDEFKNEASKSSVPEQLPISLAEVQINNPFEEYETLSVAKPEFRGVGPKNTVLTLAIEGKDTINTSVQSDSTGKWTYSPLKSLTDGSYTLKISYIDNSKNPQTVERSFIIAAASGTGGTTPAYTASTSGKKVTPTPTPKPTPVSTKSAVRKSMPSTISGTPKSGFELPTIIVLLFGLGLFTSGIGWKLSLKRNL